MVRSVSVHHHATTGRAGLTRRRWAVGAVLAVLVAVLFVIHRLALGDLRRLESEYIAAREPTACANQSLVPFTTGGIDLDALDEAVEEAIFEARKESRELHERSKKRKVSVIPAVSAAADALDDALTAQVRLYDVLVDDPAGSDDELEQLGRRNGQFERRIGRLRNILLVGAGDGWSTRFVCDRPPPG